MGFAIGPGLSYFALSPLFIDAFISEVTSSKIPMLSLDDEVAGLQCVHCAIAG